MRLKLDENHQTTALTLTLQGRFVLRYLADESLVYIGGLMSFGRAYGQLVLPDDHGISRSHGVIFEDGGRLFLQDDPNVPNPTLIDNVPATAGKPVQVSPGAVLMIGQYRFRVEPAPLQPAKSRAVKEESCPGAEPVTPTSLKSKTSYWIAVFGIVVIAVVSYVWTLRPPSSQGPEAEAPSELSSEAPSSIPSEATSPSDIDEVSIAPDSESDSIAQEPSEAELMPSPTPVATPAPTATPAPKKPAAKKKSQRRTASQKKEKSPSLPRKLPPKKPSRDKRNHKKK